MANLLDEIITFFTKSGERTDEEKARNAITIIQGCQDLIALTALSTALPGGVVNMPVVAAAFEARKTEIEKEQDHGIYGPIAKALYDGFGDLAKPMQEALAGMVAGAFEPNSDPLSTALKAAMDPALDAALKAMVPGEDQAAADLRKVIRTKILPIVQMDVTICTGTILAEMIHPAKEMGFGNLSHVLHDTFGFRSMADAWVGPLSRAMVTTPIEKSINRILQPYMPIQGELTGLARKHEITKDQYRDAMRGYGVKEEYIDALLTGFWADPRLFEIVRIIPYARPPGACPADAAAWLTKAGMGQYIGKNWWLAMKFAKAGYDDIDIPVLIDVVNAMYLQKELGDIRTVKKNQYKTGQITRKEYESFLIGRGLDPAEIGEMLDAVAVENKAEFSAEKQRLFEKKYLNGRISLEDLRAAFKLIPLDETYIQLRTEYLAEQRLGKLREDLDNRTLTMSQVLDAYETGLWTRAAAIAFLDTIGWTVNDANVILDLTDRKMIADDNAEVIRAAEQKARNLRLSRAELLDVYKQAGKRDAWAEARADYINEIITGKEKVE